MPKKILIIDDDASLQTVLEIALQQAGFEVALAGNGEEGIQQVAQSRPDAVVSDLMMPQMDGVQFVRTVHEQLQYDNIPLIVMTALSRKPWFAELEDEGAIILQKPFDVDTFVSLIKLQLAD